METKLDRIAAKARSDTKFKFTSLCHHITRELLWENLCHIPNKTAVGTDGIDVKQAKKDFEVWSNEMLQAIHNKGYKAPATRRVWITKPGKTAKRPIAVPCVSDRALQRSVATVLTVIWEQDFLTCSFGGRPNVGAHHALATLDNIIQKKKVNFVYEADLKNFFGSLSQEWILRFVQHRVGDPRIINLIRRWLKAGTLEGDEWQPSDIGTAQGGSISVLLSNIYLHYVLDVWFDKVVKSRLRGEAYLVRYIDDFVVCFQYHTDAVRFERVMHKRLEKFFLKIEESKTRLVEFGRFAQQHAKEKSVKLETMYFLGFTHYCTQGHKGYFRLGRKTEKTRFRRSMENMSTLIREVMHYPLRKQQAKINQVLQGHYAYYGLGGNMKSLDKMLHLTRRCWHKTLNKRGGKKLVTWEKFHALEQKFPLQKPRLYLPCEDMTKMAVL